MQGHARKAKQLQHAAGHETDDSPDNGPSTRVDNGNMQQAAQQWQRLGPLDLVDKNKKCRQGGCKQHLVSARDSKDEKDKTNRYSLAKTQQDATWARAACCPAVASALEND